jgi:hypothetical protein
MAFDKYQQIMEPFVKTAQKLPPGAPGIVHPETWWGVWILNTLAGLAARLIAFFTILGLDFDSLTNSKGFKLPDYQEYYKK